MRLTYLIYLFVLTVLAVSLQGVAKDAIPAKHQVKKACPPASRPKVSRASVYAGKPFGAGEESVYDVHYGPVYVGQGKLSVGEAYEFPQKSGHYNQVFDAYGKTGEWFRPIYQAENRARSVSNPANFAANWFYIDQNEGRMFDDPRVSQKTLVFGVPDCKATETRKRPGRKDRVRKAFFFNQSIDALAAGFKIRAIDYKVGRRVRLPVFTSRKNWWLELEPIKVEVVKTGIGRIKGMKLKH